MGAVQSAEDSDNQKLNTTINYEVVTNEVRSNRYTVDAQHYYQ